MKKILLAVSLLLLSQPAFASDCENKGGVCQNYYAGAGCSSGYEWNTSFSCQESDQDYRCCMPQITYECNGSNDECVNWSCSTGYSLYSDGNNYCKQNSLGNYCCQKPTSTGTSCTDNSGISGSCVASNSCTGTVLDTSTCGSGYECCKNSTTGGSCTDNSGNSGSCVTTNSCSGTILDTSTCGNGYECCKNSGSTSTTTSGSGITIPSNTGLPDPSGGVMTVLATFLGWILNIFLMLAVIAFVISGVMYLFALGDSHSDAAQKAKKNFHYAILAIVAVGSGYIILYTISMLLGGVIY